MTKKGVTLFNIASATQRLDDELAMILPGREHGTAGDRHELRRGALFGQRDWLRFARQERVNGGTGGPDEVYAVGPRGDCGIFSGFNLFLRLAFFGDVDIALAT